MTYVADSFDTLSPMPAWVTSARAKAAEDVAFLSGAALIHLHLVVHREDVPQALLRARLALRASEASMTHLGRPERAGELRDAVGFLQPGDSPGPAGEVYLSRLRAVERPVTIKALHRSLPHVEAAQIATWLDAAGQGAPVARAAIVLSAVLEDRPRDLSSALILADATLAQSLGWTHVLPLLGLGLKRADIRKTGSDLHVACHQAIRSATIEAVREATSLGRRAAKLREVAPKLRARGRTMPLHSFSAVMRSHQCH